MNLKKIVLFSCLILILTLLFLPVYASITTYFSDGFESFPTGWNNSSDSGGSLTKVAFSHSGTYSALINSSATLSYAYTYNTAFSAITVSFHTQIWFWTNKTYDNGIIIIGPYGGSYAYTIGAMYYSSNSTYMLYIGDIQAGTYKNIASFSSNTWHSLDVYYNRSIYVHIYLDGTKQSGDWTALNSNANINPIQTYLGDVSALLTYYNGQMFYDDLVFDNATEPTGGTTINENGSLTINQQFLNQRALSFSRSGTNMENSDVSGSRSFIFYRYLYGAFQDSLAFSGTRNLIVSKIGFISENLALTLTHSNQFRLFGFLVEKQTLSMNGSRLSFPFGYVPSASRVTITFDYQDFLFGSGRYIALGLIIAGLFLINFLNKYSFVVTVTLSLLMCLLYFQNKLIWEAVTMAIMAIVLILTSWLKND